MCVRCNFRFPSKKGRLSDEKNAFKQGRGRPRWCSQCICHLKIHKNRSLLTHLSPTTTPKSLSVSGFCTYSYYNNFHPPKATRPFGSYMPPHYWRLDQVLHVQRGGPWTCFASCFFPGLISGRNFFKLRQSTAFYYEYRHQWDQILHISTKNMQK